jgi:hypothetical protein
MIVGALQEWLTPSIGDMKALMNKNEQTRITLFKECKRVQESLVHPQSVTSTEDSAKLNRVKEWCDRIDEVEQRLLQLNAALDEIDQWSRLLLI